MPPAREPNFFKLLLAAIVVKAADVGRRFGRRPGPAVQHALAFLVGWISAVGGWATRVAWPLFKSLILASGRALRALGIFTFRISRRAALWTAPRIARGTRIAGGALGVASVLVAQALFVALVFWARLITQSFHVAARASFSLAKGLVMGTLRLLALILASLFWMMTNIPNGLRRLADVRLGDVVSSPWLIGRFVGSRFRRAGTRVAFWQPERFTNESNRLRARGVVALALLVAANAVFYAGFTVVDATAEPRNNARVLGVKLSPLPERSHILARDGTEIAVLFKDENRQVVDLSQIAPVMAETTIAVEDRRFYKHHGFDLRGTLRAVIRNLLEGRALEGGSTITQQYVRSRYLENTRTIGRKFREIMLAIQLEQKYTKDKILEAYLNGAYFGEGNYGVEAASESYFGIHASQLNAEQAALLVSLLRSPNSSSPFVNAQEVVHRRNLVLDQMAQAEIITPTEHDELVQLPLKVREEHRTDEVKMAPHFVEFVKRRLLQDQRLGDTYKERYRAVFSGGLSITTSLDPRVHEAAERAVAKLPKGVPEAAVVVMDPQTGDLLAYRGGTDFDARKFDLVSQGRRQPGSAFKTFALVTALSSNFSPSLSLGGSSPCEFEQPQTSSWKVENFGGHSYGTVSLKEATAKSINCAYADLVMNHIDPREVMTTAESMGIDSPLDPYPSIALGGLTNGVTPLEMTRSFATLAGEGLRPKVRPILEVRDRNGDVIISDPVESEQVLEENVARMTTAVLREVVESGTATDAKGVERPAAGKTGTTQANRDAWFIGYTPQFVGSVWLGHPDAQIEMKGVTGGSVAAGIWAAVMLEAHRGIDPTDFEDPETEEFFRSPATTEVTQTTQSNDVKPFDRPKPRGRERD